MGVTSAEGFPERYEAGGLGAISQVRSQMAVVSISRVETCISKVVEWVLLMAHGR